MKECTLEQNNKQILMLLGTVVLTSIIILTPELSHAATTTATDGGVRELNDAFSRIKTMVAGPVGKITALVSVGFALVASMTKMSFAVWGSTVGVALGASLGPSMVESVVGAIV